MKIHECEQGSPEWFRLRLGIPTATDFADVITAARGDVSASAGGLIDRLIDELVRPELQENDFAGNKHTERGKELEPAARAWYAYTKNVNVVQVGFVTRDDGRAGCSPDGLIDAPCFGFVGGLEIKCPDGPTHVGYVRAGCLPPKYKQQVHGSMFVTGLRWWDFVSYCPGYVPFVVRVEWDAYTDKLAAGLEVFLEQFDAAKKEFALREYV